MLHTVGFTSSDSFKCLENLKKGAVDLCLTYCGWEKCDPGHRFGPNNRISHVLHIVESGSGVFEMDGHQYHLTGGEAFLIPSSVELVSMEKQGGCGILYPSLRGDGFFLSKIPG